MASNLRMRSVRQAYDDVVSEGSPHNYQEFIQHAASADQIDRKSSDVLKLNGNPPPTNRVPICISPGGRTLGPFMH